MLRERTEARDLATGLFRGLAAATRGYVNAKVNVARARSDRDRDKAQFALTAARLELVKQKQDFEAQHQQDTLASQEREAEAQREHETQLQEVVVDGQKAVAKISADGQIELMTVQQADETERAGMAADTAREGFQSQERIAEGEQSTRREGFASQERIAAGGEAGETERTQIQSGAATDIAETEADAAVQVTEIKNRPVLGGSGKSAVSTDAARHFGQVYDRVARSTPYKILESSQNVVPRMLALFEDGNADAADDLALVNMFQRMIDPGVSVREGDVDLQQSTQSAWARFELAIKRVQEGALLTPELRESMIQTAIDLANEDYRVLLPKIQDAANGMINMNHELAAAGYDISDFFMQPLQQFTGTVQLDDTTGAVRLLSGQQSEPGTVGTDGKMTQGDRTQGAGIANEEEVVSQLVEQAAGLFDAGKQADEVRSELVSYLQSKGLDQATVDRIAGQVMTLLTGPAQ